MQQEILDYLKTERVCVVAVEMPDGSPHAATVHFALHAEPLAFIIQTSPRYRKSEALRAKDMTRASLVVGTEEAPDAKDVTLQVDGVARLVQPEEKQFIETYLAKFPNKDKKFNDDIFFIVTPTWWHYTKWGTQKGKIVLTSPS